MKPQELYVCRLELVWQELKPCLNLVNFWVWGEPSSLCSTGRRSAWLDGFEANEWSALQRFGGQRLAACVNEPGGKADRSGALGQMISGVRSVAVEPFWKSSRCSKTKCFLLVSATFMWLDEKQFVPCRCLGASWTRLCRTWYCRWQPVSIWEPSRLQTVDFEMSCPVLIQCRQLR